MAENDTMFNEGDQRCAAVQIMPSTDPSYDNWTIASTLKMEIWRWPTSPKRPRLDFRRSATTFYPFLNGPFIPKPESAGILPLVIRREHHQYDLPQHQSQPDRRHPPSIHRAPASASVKSMLPVPNP